ncbi:MAG: hypothetical protein N2037_08805 [Acidimicrobiales bacterium]|nr:hypothetical protein [Acidimicrobiales bacterium]
MDYRQLLRQVSVARIAIGSALALVPGLAGRVWVGDGARDPATKVAIRALGIRDAAIGAGALHALETGVPPRPWTVAGAASDVVDAIGTVLALRCLPRRRALAIIAVAASSAAVHLLAADQLD